MDLKESYEIKLPDVGEYSKEMKLSFEKEVLGIYVSGHPLEEYQDIWMLMNCFLVPPRLSMAPALMKFSMARLLTSLSAKYQDIWHKHITNTTTDFLLDEETDATIVKDGATVTLGGIIADKRLKYTKPEAPLLFPQTVLLSGT